MNCNPTLTAKEFSTVHNGLWKLGQVISKLENIVHPDLLVQLLNAQNEIRTGLNSAYEQDEKSFEQKLNHYDDIANQLSLHQSTWSIYEVKDMSDRHPFEGANRVVYKDHWGKEAVQASVNGLTWSALFVAANACIRDSGDKHHHFIETFTPDKNDPGTLILSTGS
jgi:hypothetical protein